MDNPPQSGLPRSFSFLVLVIVVWSVLRKLRNCVMRCLDNLVVYPSQGLTSELEIITEMMTNDVDFKGHRNIKVGHGN